MDKVCQVLKLRLWDILASSACREFFSSQGLQLKGKLQCVTQSHHQNSAPACLLQSSSDRNDEGLEAQVQSYETCSHTGTLSLSHTLSLSLSLSVSLSVSVSVSVSVPVPVPVLCLSLSHTVRMLLWSWNCNVVKGEGRKDRLMKRMRTWGAGILANMPMNMHACDDKVVSPHQLKLELELPSPCQNKYACVLELDLELEFEPPTPGQITPTLPRNSNWNSNVELKSLLLCPNSNS